MTARLIEVLQLFGAGETADEIAKKLFLSSGTIHTHRKRIFWLMQAKNIANACWLFQEYRLKKEREKIEKMLAALRELTKKDRHAARLLKQLNLL